MQENSKLKLQNLELSTPAICVPLVARTVAEALEQLPRLVAAGPDLIEVRLDYFEGLSAEQTGPLLTQLKAVCQLPLLVTFRRKEEGGARPLAEAHRIEILHNALATGTIAMLDVELQTSQTARDELLSAARRVGVPGIISYHDFASTPPYHALAELIKALAATDADILKLAVYPRTSTDALNLLAVTYEASSTWLDRPLVTMAMGGLGGFTRLAGPLFGSVLTFAVADTERSSAPGQPKIDIVRELWQNWAVRDN